MAIIALVLAWATLVVDERLATAAWHSEWWYGGGPEGARAVLSVVAGSMMTVAGVVFSIMMVVLSLAAQQYGPRLLRNFMRDRVTQFALGVFIATFLYCLTVLRTIRGENHEEFVPQVSVTTGVALSMLSLSVLIYFIHHVATSISIDQIITGVQRELLSTIDKIYPEMLGKDDLDVDSDRAATLPADFDVESSPIAAATPGYVEAVEDDAFMKLATEHDLVLRMNVRPGDFVSANQTLMWAWPARNLDGGVRDSLRQAVLTGQRTPLQDLLFALHQQTDIAVRALSPGINDPFTAIQCLDMLSEALCELLRRRIPSAERFDEEGRLRVVARGVAFAEVTQASLGLIRQYARNSPAVTSRILEVVGRLADCLSRRVDCQALVDQVDAIAGDDYSGMSQFDLARLRSVQEATYRRLERARAGKLAE